jgi:hypothetical protein
VKKQRGDIVNVAHCFEREGRFGQGGGNSEWGGGTRMSLTEISKIEQLLRHFATVKLLYLFFKGKVHLLMIIE